LIEVKKYLSKTIVFMSLVALAFVAGCSKTELGKVAPPAPVLTAKVAVKNMPVRIEPPPVGHVTPTLSVNVRPQIGGIIQSVNFKEGQDVAKGDLLFTLDSRPAAATLARDQAQLKNAQIQFDRDQTLFEQKLISQDQHDTSKANRDALAATVRADELNLAYSEIRAPIAGRTGSLLVHEGNVVKAPDDELVSINQIHPIYAVFAVAERWLPQIQKQMRGRTLTVSASYENMEGEPPLGELTFVDNTVDPSTGTIQLKATFPNDDGRLWPGQFVQLGLQLDELINVVVVPSQAVQAGQNGSFVFVVQADKTVEVRPVKTSVTVKGETAVLSGLQTGETVVTEGQLRLAPGVVVSDQTSAMNAP
jgi:multidrug efflux system membrane fusion protein